MKNKIILSLLMLFSIHAFSQTWQQYNALAPGDTGPSGNRNTACLSADGNLVLATQVAIPASDPAPFPLTHYLLVQELEKSNGNILKERIAYVPNHPLTEAKGMVRHKDKYHILVSTGTENTGYADAYVAVFDDQLQLEDVNLLSAALNFNRVLFNTGEDIAINYSCYFRQEVICVIGESGMGVNSPDRNDIVWTIYNPEDFSILASNKLSISPYDIDSYSDIHIASITPTADGSFVFNGTITTQSDQIPFAGKIGADGSTEWVNLYKTGTKTHAQSTAMHATRDTIYLQTDSWLAYLDYQGLVIGAYSFTDPTGKHPAVYSIASQASQLLLAGSNIIGGNLISFNSKTAQVSWAQSYPQQVVWEVMAPDNQVLFTGGQNGTHTTGQALDFASGVTMNCFESVDINVSAKAVFPRSLPFQDSSLMVTVSQTMGDFPYTSSQDACYDLVVNEAKTIETRNAILELSEEPFELFDMAARLIYKGKGTATDAMELKEIFKSLPSGIYILRYPSGPMLISL